MPNRIIKETITTSATLAQLSDGEERHFWRLLVQADDYGYLDAREEVIRARAYPLMLDRVAPKVSEARTQALAGVGLLHLFELEGKRYAHFPTWERHQQVRAKRRRYPQVESCEGVCNQMISDDSNGNQMLLARAPARFKNLNPNPNPNPNPEEETPARKKREAPSVKAVASAAALLQIFSEEEMVEIKRRFPATDLEWEAGKCVAYHMGKGGSGNWKLAYKNWLDGMKQHEVRNGIAGPGAQKANVADQWKALLPPPERQAEIRAMRGLPGPPISPGGSPTGSS